MLAYKNFKPQEGGLALIDVAVPVLRSGDALIKITAAGINYRDMRIAEGTYTFKFQYDTIIGSDATGEVVAVCDDENIDWVGKQVLINPNVNWGDDFHSPSESYSILGTPTNGVFSEYAAVAIHRLIVKPLHLTVEAAACLPLVGITAYRAIFTKADIKAGQRILITGVSGGVAQFALQLAVSAKAEVWITSSSKEKIGIAKRYGAFGGCDYNKGDLGDFFEKRKIKFHSIIDCAGGDQVASLLKLLLPMGKLVLYGAMNGNIGQVDLANLYYNQLSIVGTLMGNDEEFVHMVEYVDLHKISPVVSEVFAFEQIDEAFARLKRRDHFGKLVLAF